ncbi:MAG: hypothetical protein QOC71_1702 [Thermoplasmata archaeon]|jgi:hypothetical protein|nr:hypothetical protein [Thermoplasmata archaeon]
MAAAWLRGILLGAVLLLAAPMVEAGSPSAPELADDAEDVMVYDLNLPPQVPLPPPLQDAIDVRGVWFADDAEGLHAYIQVADLSTLELQTTGNPDFFWVAIWSPGYAVEDGAAARRGPWELRADYRPLDSPAWHFWLERPCRDGDSDDGCAGPDRDILDGLRGDVDVGTSTIHIVAPWSHMSEPMPGDGIQGLWASAQMTWPSYPAYSVDWDIDQADQCYRFVSLPFPPEALNATDAGALGSSNGRTAMPMAYAPKDVCQSDGQGLASVETPGSSSSRTGGGGRGAPGTPAVGALMAGLAAAALRRRR